MKTSVVQIGTSKAQTEAVLQHAKELVGLEQQKLANRLRDLAETKLVETIEKVIHYLSRRMEEKAFDRKFEFNMRKYVGDACHVDCTIDIRDKIIDWLKSEGFVVETKENKLNPNPTPRRGFSTQNTTDAYQERLTNEFILLISW